MATQPTIIDLKTIFLRAQIRTLSQPLFPSPTVLARLTTDEHALRQRNIDNALAKLNAQIRRHNKLAYGPQALRHVAEQIDRLYWGAGERDVNVVELEWVERGADYRKEEIIAQLPTEWSEEATEQAPEQAARFEALRKRLVEVKERRRAAREQLERYRGLGALVGILSAEGVQENLVTKTGEVEMELERMRMLMLRVERGLEGLGERGVGEEMDIDIEKDEEMKLRALLGS